MSLTLARWRKNGKDDPRPASKVTSPHDSRAVRTCGSLLLGTTRLRAWRASRTRGFPGPTPCRGRAGRAAWPRASASTSSPATASSTSWASSSCLRSREFPWSNCVWGTLNCSICLTFIGSLTADADAAGWWWSIFSSRGRKESSCFHNQENTSRHP